MFVILTFVQTKGKFIKLIEREEILKSERDREEKKIKISNNVL
jgi:hypothetical protein